MVNATNYFGLSVNHTVYTEASRHNISDKALAGLQL